MQYIIKNIIKHLFQRSNFEVKKGRRNHIFLRDFEFFDKIYLFILQKFPIFNDEFLQNYTLKMKIFLK